jgi:NadR type nicotinamide-nucleotide adenylyltransferase
MEGRAPARDAGVTRRVVVTGSECTGKSTLAAALAAHYATGWSPEFVREFVAAREGPVRAEDVDAIAKGQMRAEDALAAGSGRLLIHDTDLLSTAIYSRHYFGDCPAWIEDEVMRRKADLYLLAGIDVPWQADAGQRDRGDRREEMHALFREALAARRFQAVELAGPHEARLAAAIRAIEAIL